MSKKNNNYEDAKAQYDSAISAYNEALKQYTGNSGYKNATQQAKTTAGDLSKSAAKGAQASAQTAARNAGMSKAQASALGSQQASNAYQNAYQNNFNNQQGIASSMGNAAVSGKANTVNSAQGQQSYAQTEDQNKWNRGWSAAGGIVNATGQVANTVGSLLASDERLKNYRKVSGKLVKVSPEKIKSLKWESK